MKRLIYQVNVTMDPINFAGNKRFRYVQDLYKLSHTQARKYAKQVNADYIQITDCSYLPDKHPIYQKFKVFEFNDYDQILYLDSDAVLTDNNPDIFELYGHYDFSSTHEVDWESGSAYYKTFRERYNKALGASKEYRPFNSGVMLFNRTFLERNKDNWRKYLDTFEVKGAQDQGMFNRLVIDEGEKYNLLPLDWGTCCRKGKHIIHLFGHKKNNFDIDKFCKLNNLQKPQ